MSIPTGIVASYATLLFRLVCASVYVFFHFAALPHATPHKLTPFEDFFPNLLPPYATSSRSSFDIPGCENIRVFFFFFEFFEFVAIFFGGVFFCYGSGFGDVLVRVRLDFQNVWFWKCRSTNLLKIVKEFEISVVIVVQ